MPEHVWLLVVSASVSYKFGLVSMAAGIVGVPLGSLIAQRLRPRYPDCDPIICGFGLITSAPIVFLALVLASSHAMWCLTLVFLGEVFLNLTWSIIADMLLVRFHRGIPTKLGTTLQTKLPVELFHECFFFDMR